MNILFPVLQSDGSVIERVVAYNDGFAIPSRPICERPTGTVRQLRNLGFEIKQDGDGYLINDVHRADEEYLEDLLARQQRIQSTQGA